MRHRVYGKHLGRDKNQRTALIRGLIRSLILNESITTTQTKASAIKGLIDRLITKSKKGTNAAKAVINSILPQADISKKLVEEIAPRYQGRTSGFTQIIRLGPRVGDGAMMVRISLISEDQKDLKKSGNQLNRKISKLEKAETKKTGRRTSK